MEYAVIKEKTLARRIDEAIDRSKGIPEKPIYIVIATKTQSYLNPSPIEE